MTLGHKGFYSTAGLLDIPKVNQKTYGNMAIRFFVVTPTSEVNVLCVVCLSVWKQDCAKPNNKPIFMKLGGRVYHWPRKNSLNFGGYPIWLNVMIHWEHCKM